MAPHGHRGLPPREGSPGHRSRRHPPSFPPSLLRPPSLPRTLPLAGPSRGQPALDQIQFSRPGHNPSAAEMCGAYSLVQADRGAPRTAYSLNTPGCRAPDSPNTQQTSRSFLQTQHPVAWLAADHRPGVRSAQSVTDVHTQSTLSLFLCPARTPFHPLGYTWARTHTKLCALVFPCIPPLSPLAAFTSPVLKKGRIFQRVSRSKADCWGEVPGRPQRISWAEPKLPLPARHLRDQGSPRRALAFSSFSRKSQTHAESSAL